MPIYVAFFAGLTLFAGAQAFFWFRQARQKRLEELIRKRIGGQRSAENLMRKRGADASATIAKLIEQAGLQQPPELLMRRAGFGLFLLAIFGAFVGGVALAMAMMMIGVMAGYITLIELRDRRIQKVNMQLPRALEIMVLALRAGHTLPRAVNIAAEEIPAPLGHELRRMHEEHSLGRPIEEGFVALSQRLEGCEALRSVVTSILILRQTGGNLVEVLERVMESISAQTQFKQRLRALTAEGRMSAVILMSLPGVFTILMVAVQPAYMAPMVQTGTGKFLIVLITVLWIGGSIWTQRLLKAQS